MTTSHYPTAPALLLLPAQSFAPLPRPSQPYMTLARLDIFGLLACPVCSYLRAEHPELVNDALALPVLWQGRGGGLWYLSDRCMHGADLFGPYYDEATARMVWNGRMDALAGSGLL